LRIEIALENVISPESARQPSNFPREIGGNAQWAANFLFLRERRVPACGIVLK